MSSTPTRQRGAASLMLACGVIFGGCQRETEETRAMARNEVVVYSSADEVYARPVVDAFTKRTGIRVKLVSDAEETKSTGLLNRLIAEKARPRADVFWSGDPVRAAILKAKGVSAPYRSPNAAEMPTQYNDSNGHWQSLSARARVILYNKNLIKPGEEPKSMN